MGTKNKRHHHSLEVSARKKIENSDKPSSSCHLENWSNDLLLEISFSPTLPSNWVNSFSELSTVGSKIANRTHCGSCKIVYRRAFNMNNICIYAVYAACIGSRNGATINAIFINNVSSFTQQP